MSGPPGDAATDRGHGASRGAAPVAGRDPASLLGTDDPSAEARRYAAKRAYYQRPEVAATYAQERWSTGSRRRSLRRKMATLSRAFELVERDGGPVRSCLDVACGTGRFFELLGERGTRAVGTDLSFPMLRVAREEPASLRVPLVRSEAEALPFRDEAFDAVLCMRFLFHLSSEVRTAALTEMARVARRWVLFDFRHRHNLGYHLRRAGWRAGLRASPPRRGSRADLERECGAAGLEPVWVLPTARAFTDKWVVAARVLGSR